MPLASRYRRLWHLISMNTFQSFLHVWPRLRSCVFWRSTIDTFQEPGPEIFDLNRPCVNYKVTRKHCRLYCCLTVVSYSLHNTQQRSVQLQQRQETRLSLINRATRLEVSQCQKHGTIPYVRYGFLLVYLKVPHKFCCATVPPLSEIWGGGHVPPPALWRGRLWTVGFNRLWTSVYFVNVIGNDTIR